MFGKKKISNPGVLVTVRTSGPKVETKASFSMKQFHLLQRFAEVPRVGDTIIGLQFNDGPYYLRAEVVEVEHVYNQTIPHVYVKESTTYVRKSEQ